jgi:hypothetical protein
MSRYYRIHCEFAQVLLKFPLFQAAEQKKISERKITRYDSTLCRLLTEKNMKLLCEGIFSAPAFKETLIHAQPKEPALISR